MQSGDVGSQATGSGGSKAKGAGMEGKASGGKGSGKGWQQRGGKGSEKGPHGGKSAAGDGGLGKQKGHGKNKNGQHSGGKGKQKITASVSQTCVLIPSGGALQRAHYVYQWSPEGIPWHETDAMCGRASSLQAPPLESAEKVVALYKKAVLRWHPDKVP